MLKYILILFQAKMMTLHPKELAVYDLTNGSVLWKSKCIFDNLMIKSIFINEIITGLLFQKSLGHYQGEVFDTSTGNLITKLVITTTMFEGSKKNKDFIRTKGPYICYTKGLEFHAIRASSHSETIEYTFPFPLEIYRQDILHFYRACTKFLVPKYFSLLGFVAKSHVLLGQLWFECHDKPLLVSLDIEAAVAARDEEEVKWAFSLPLLEHDEDFSFSPCYNGYSPVYKTDRPRGQVDLVGVTCPTWKNCYQNYCFVNKFEYQDEDL